LNPVFVHEKGAVAVDALIVIDYSNSITSE